MFQKRTVVFIGHDAQNMNPLLATMVDMLIKEENTIKNPPLFLSSTTLDVPSCFLHFSISPQEEEALHDIIAPGSEKNFIIGEST